MATQGRIERRAAAILAVGIKRREFIAHLGAAALALPLAAQAQQAAKIHRIAIVHPSNPVTDMTETGALTYRALFAELRRLGYVEGPNFIVERYSGEGRTEHYADLAREVVQRRPDVILVSTVRMVQNFKAAATTIPIVGFMADPVVSGLVASLARPGGNITGVSTDAGLEVWGKRVGLLREAIPGASRIGFLASRDVDSSVEGAAMREAAQQAGLSLVGPPLESAIQEAAYRRVFDAMVLEHVDGLIVSDQAEHFTHRRVIVELAERSRVPAFYPYRPFVELGGLMTYGIDLADMYRRAAGYLDQILKGSKPSEMPIDQATKFELVINVKAAKAIGLNLPSALLLRADKVIE